MEQEEKLLFSIIVPVYNIEKYIRQCIESIIRQNADNFEVIAVDDGSTDGSGAILDDYANEDKRIKVIHKSNGGLVSARKAGMEVAKGKYIINVDGDDYIADDFLSTLSNLIENNNKPDMVAFGCVHFSETSQSFILNACDTGMYSGKKLDNLQEGMIYNKNMCSVNTGTLLYGVCLKVVKREIVYNLQMAVPEKISKGEDLAVTAQLIFECASVYVSDYCGYFYRNNPTSIVNTFVEGDVQKYKLLYDYLDKAVDRKYHNNINAHALRCYEIYINMAVGHFEKYREFKKCMRKNSNIISKRIADAKIYLPSVKERIRIFLIKNRLWYFIWKLRKR